MNKKDLIKLGSKTAKGGFKNEDDIVRKFNEWKTDEDAKKWLEIMGYPIKEIEKGQAGLRKRPFGDHHQRKGQELLFGRKRILEAT